MSVLDNQRHELFAQNVAKGMNQTEAYIEAGYSEEGANGNAARLMANDAVKERVRELQASAAQKTETSVERLLLAGWEILDSARRANNFNAASATLERLAKISGNWIDRSKSEVVTPIGELLDALEG